MTSFGKYNLNFWCESQKATEDSVSLLFLNCEIKVHMDKNIHTVLCKQFILRLTVHSVDFIDVEETKEGANEYIFKIDNVIECDFAMPKYYSTAKSDHKSDHKFSISSKYLYCISTSITSSSFIHNGRYEERKKVLKISESPKLSDIFSLFENKVEYKQTFTKEIEKISTERLIEFTPN